MKKVFWIALGIGLGVVGVLFIKNMPSLNSDTLFIMLATILGLIGVAIITLIQTNRQIRNQNKQLFRPFLDFEIKEKSDEEKEDDACLFCPSKTLSNNLTLIWENKEYKNRYYKCAIKNNGKGPAINIYFYDCYSKAFMPKTVVKEYTGKRSIEKNKLSPLRLNIEAETTEWIDLWYKNSKEKDDTSEYASIIIMYSDINGNTYKTLINISLEIENEKIVDEEYIEYYEENIKFRRMIKKIGLKISTIEKEYLKEAWNRKIRKSL